MGWWRAFLALFQGARRNRVRHSRSVNEQETQVAPHSTSHLTILRQGATQWNFWRQQHPALRPDLQGVDLRGMQLGGYDFAETDLRGADFRGALLAGADLRGAHLEGANLSHVRFVSGADDEPFPSANLQYVFFDHASNLEGAILGDGGQQAALLADAHWNGVNLTVVDWKRLRRTGEDGQAERHRTRLRYRSAARASHQLAVALQEQGLYEEAGTYAYRARVLQRKAPVLQTLTRSRTGHERWIVRLLQLRGQKTRFWRAMAALLPAILIAVLLLVFFGSQSSAVGSVLIPILGLLLGLLFALTLLAALPPLHKQVLLLLCLTLLFPLLLISLLGVSFSTLSRPFLTGPPADLVSTEALFAALWMALIVFVAYALLTLLPHRFTWLRHVLESWWQGYCSLYPLLGLTIVDYGKILFSSFLDTLAGYGFHPSKSFRSYLLLISGFAVLYWLFGYFDGYQTALETARHLHRAVKDVVPVLKPLEALVYSVTSFHGRGFFPGSGIRLDDPLVVLAALEAMVGLVIEVSFIATFTQRFLAR